MNEKDLSAFYSAHPEVLASLEQEEIEDMTYEELDELATIADERKFGGKDDR